MAPSIQVFVQVAILCCVVTTSMGGITDWQKAFSQLENKVMVQQEEIKSLHHIIEHLEKRLEQLEVKGEFVEVQIQPAVPTLHACQSEPPFMGLFHVRCHPHWLVARKYTIKWRMVYSTLVSMEKNSK